LANKQIRKNSNVNNAQLDQNYNKNNDINVENKNNKNKTSGKKVNDNTNNSNTGDKLINKNYNHKNKKANNNENTVHNTINFSDINFYEKTLPTGHSNGSFSSVDSFSLTNHQESYINDNLNDVSEKQTHTVYKLLDEDIVNEEFSLDVHETLNNIINNRRYLPTVIDVKKNDLYSIVHDKELRKKYFNSDEIQLCPLVIIFFDFFYINYKSFN